MASVPFFAGLNILPALLMTLKAILEGRARKEKRCQGQFLKGWGCLADANSQAPHFTFPPVLATITHLPARFSKTSSQTNLPLTIFSVPASFFGRATLYCCRIPKHLHVHGPQFEVVKFDAAGFQIVQKHILGEHLATASHGGPIVRMELAGPLDVGSLHRIAKVLFDLFEGGHIRWVCSRRRCVERAGGSTLRPPYSNVRLSPSSETGKVSALPLSGLMRAAKNVAHDGFFVNIEAFLLTREAFSFVGDLESVRAAAAHPHASSKKRLA